MNIYFCLLGILAVGFIIFGIYFTLSVSKKAKKNNVLFLENLKSQGFNIEDKKVLKQGAFETDYYFDYTNKKFVYTDIDTNAGDLKPSVTFPLDKMVAVALIKDGTAVHKNAVVPAMLGAKFFGLGGAIAGATAMHSEAQVGTIAIKVLFEGFNPPAVLLPIIESSVSKSDELYTQAFMFAQELYGIFEGVILNNKAEKEKHGGSVKVGTKKSKTDTAKSVK